MWEPIERNGARGFSLLVLHAAVKVPSVNPNVRVTLDLVIDIRRQAHPNLRNFVAFKYPAARCSRGQFSASITRS